MAKLKPVRVQLSRRRGYKLPENTVVVSRPTKWGNPFVVGEHGTREECVDNYKMLMLGLLCISAKNVAHQELHHLFVKDNIEKLKGKNLACWCPLSQPCHADVLLELANAPERA